MFSTHKGSEKKWKEVKALSWVMDLCFMLLQHTWYPSLLSKYGKSLTSRIQATIKQHPFVNSSLSIILPSVMTPGRSSSFRSEWATCNWRNLRYQLKFARESITKLKLYLSIQTADLQVYLRGAQKKLPSKYWKPIFSNLETINELHSSILFPELRRNVNANYLTGVANVFLDMVIVSLKAVVSNSDIFRVISSSCTRIM